MGIEEYLMKEAEDNINDGTYIINLDINTVNKFFIGIVYRLFLKPTVQ